MLKQYIVFWVDLKLSWLDCFEMCWYVRELFLSSSWMHASYKPHSHLHWLDRCYVLSNLLPGMSMYIVQTIIKRLWASIEFVVITCCCCCFRCCGSCCRYMSSCDQIFRSRPNIKIGNQNPDPAIPRMAWRSRLFHSSPSYLHLQRPAHAEHAQGPYTRINFSTAAVPGIIIHVWGVWRQRTRTDYWSEMRKILTTREY